MSWWKDTKRRGPVQEVAEAVRVERLEQRMLLATVPHLDWSSYLGGGSLDSAGEIATDSSGNVYVAGNTSSSTWASGGFDTSYNGGSADAFVAKIRADGTLAWSSYLGGSAFDTAESVAVDSAGNVYVGGRTDAGGWASGGFDTSFGGGSSGDSFVAKINANGTLAWSSYLGGSGSEVGAHIATDAFDNVYAVAETESSGWVSGGFDTSYGGGYDAYVAKINANGTLAWTSYMGGGSEDSAATVACDAAGNAYVVGFTASSGWVSGGFDTSYNGSDDAFVAKINANGTLAWSSYLGGGGGDYAYGVDTGVGCVFVAGQTGPSSPDWTSGGFDTTYNGGSSDTFVAKVNADGTLGWSSYLGGDQAEWASVLTTNPSGDAYIAGRTQSAGWASGGFDTIQHGGTDAFVARVNASGTLAWSSYLGGTNNDAARGLAISSSGDVYLSGATDSSGWVSGGFDTSYGGGGDGFLAKISNLSFSASVDYATGSGPWAVTTGDFNSDGKQDLAVANQGSSPGYSGSVSVRLGIGDGTFGAATDYPTGAQSLAIVSCDLNGDGRLDLITTNYMSSTVSVLLGNGNGTFAPKVDYATGGNPWGIATGDFNADGKADVAVTNYNSGVISVLLGNGNGTLGAMTNYSAGGYPIGLASGDFNGDGKLDLVCTSQANSYVSVLLGNGNGTFGSPTTYATTTSDVRWLCVADLNADGKLDVVTANGSNQVVNVLLGNGNGTFATRVSYGTGGATYSVIAKDFNGDGVLDLAAGALSGNVVSVLPGLGDGTFGVRVGFAAGPAGPSQLASADFNGDGKPDLVVTREVGNTLGVLLNSTAFPNRAPTDIALSASGIAENQPSGTTVGAFTTSDLDAGDTFTYSLVTGTGSADNASFTIIGNQLQTAASFDYETKSSYSIRVRTTDAGGLFFEKVFTIGVTNVNETPTDMALSASSIAENQPSGTVVGSLSTTDPDAGDTFTYSLVTGTGGTDNASFTINGSQLKAAAGFDFETKSSYSVRIRTTDLGGLWYDKVFAISVTDVNEAPFTLVLDDPATVGVIDVIVVDGKGAGAPTLWGPSNRSDLSRRVGEIAFSGAVGSNFMMNQTTAQSTPIVGTATQPEIRITSVDRSLTAGTLYIWATDAYFTVPAAGDYQFNSPIGGVAGTTVQMVEAIDLTNSAFGGAAGPSSTLTGSYANQTPSYGPGAYSGTTNGTFTVLDASRRMSLTKRITVTHSAGRQTSLTAGGRVSQLVLSKLHGANVQIVQQGPRPSAVFSPRSLVGGLVRDDSVLAGVVDLGRPVFA